MFKIFGDDKSRNSGAGFPTAAEMTFLVGGLVGKLILGVIAKLRQRFGRHSICTSVKISGVRSVFLKELEKTGQVSRLFFEKSALARPRHQSHGDILAFRVAGRFAPFPRQNANNIAKANLGISCRSVVPASGVKPSVTFEAMSAHRRAADRTFEQIGRTIMKVSAALSGLREVFSGQLLRVPIDPVQPTGQAYPHSS